MSGGQEKVREWKRRKKFLLVFWAEHMFHLNHELVNKSIWIYTLVPGDIYANNFPLYTRFVDILSSNVMQNSKAVQWENTTVLVDILRLFLLPVFLVFKVQYPVWLMHVHVPPVSESVGSKKILPAPCTRSICISDVKTYGSHQVIYN